MVVRGRSRGVFGLNLDVINYTKMLLMKLAKSLTSILIWKMCCWNNQRMFKVKIKVNNYCKQLEFRTMIKERGSHPVR